MDVTLKCTAYKISLRVSGKMSEKATRELASGGEVSHL